MPKKSLVYYNTSIADWVLQDTCLVQSSSNKDLDFYQAGSQEEFEHYQVLMENKYQKRIQIEKMLALQQAPFELIGYNAIIKELVAYKVSFDYSYQVVEGVKLPNYRESVVCPKTGLNSRMRATILSLQYVLKNNDLRQYKVYLTEQTTHLYQYFQVLVPEVTGSEYLGPDMQGGTVINGIRHEDITKLSYDSESFDIIITLEVLEHVPNFKKAFQELYRCTKPEGMVLITVPFAQDLYEHRIRAIVNESGKIEHLLPPEYHGDPVNQEEGILCYQHFGWKMLDELKQAGFKKTSTLFTWSLYHGILGKETMFIYAYK